jgi:hypothetical protein
MFECPYNPGINASLCKECSKHCGFVPKEIARRKRAINKGLGLTRKANGLHKGLRYLEIKRGEQLHVNAD